MRIWRIIGGTFPALAVINCGSCDKENQTQTQVYVVEAKFIQEYDNRGKYTPACNWASFTIQQIQAWIHSQEAEGFLAGKLLRGDISSGRDSGWTNLIDFLLKAEQHDPIPRVGSEEFWSDFSGWSDIKCGNLFLTCLEFLFKLDFTRKSRNNPRRSSGAWINFGQTKNVCGWRDCVKALGGLCKCWCREVHDQLRNRWKSLMLGREGTGRSCGTWNEEGILWKMSMVWLMLSRSLRWWYGDEVIVSKGERRESSERAQPTSWLGQSNLAGDSEVYRHKRCHSIGSLQEAWVWVWGKQREEDGNWNADWSTGILSSHYGDRLLWMFSPNSYSISPTHEFISWSL